LGEHPVAGAEMRVGVDRAPRRRRLLLPAAGEQPFGSEKCESWCGPRTYSDGFEEPPLQPDKLFQPNANERIVS
jgi:hypothetical protein